MALSFAIKLTEQVSPDAKKAGAALQALHSQITSEGAALKSLENQMRTLEKGGAQNLDLYKRMATALGDQRNKVANLTAEMVKSGGAGFVPAKNNASALQSILSSLTSESGAAGEALAGLGPEGAAAAAGLGAVVVVGAAVVGALVATAGAVVYLESKLIGLGVAASEAKGDVTRSLELLYGSQKAAEQTYKVLESITGSIAISQDRVMELADHLITAGQVNGDAMIRSIETIGKAEAARKGAGKVLEGAITRATTNRIFSISRTELMAVGLTYKELSKEVAKGIGTTTQEAELRLRTGGVRVKEGLEALGRVVDAKMGDIAIKKFQTVGFQTQRLHDNFLRLFEGVDSGPFARLLMVIANQLEESSVSGAALRTLLKSAFDEASDAAERVAPFVQAFFEGAILFALKFYNAMYPVRAAIKNLFGGDSKQGLESFQDAIINTAREIAGYFKLAADAVAFIVNNLPKIAHVVSAPTGAITAGVELGVAREAGRNTALGVAEGITTNKGAVEAAMSALAYAGVHKYEMEMGIFSPSRVMRKRGRNVVDGLTLGINDNARGPADALARTGAPTVKAANDVADNVASSPRGVITGRSSDGTVVHVTFAAGSIVIGAGGSVADTKDQLTEMMADVFERANAMRGGSR